MTETLPRRRRLPTWLAWPLCVVLGLVSGVVCRVPLWATYLCTRVIAQEDGWSSLVGTLDEGVDL